MSTRLACLLALLLLSCTDSRRGGPDPGPGSDGGDPPLPPGALTLAVEGAAWYEAGALVVRVRVASGAGADPAPLAPASFALALSGGAELTASPVPGAVLAEPCRPELAVTAGGSVACELLFNSVSGSPEVLHFRPPMRAASAPIPACSSGAPGGLCGQGQICQAGSCVAQCGPSAPEGVCPSAAELCVSGTCEPRCSPSVPDGACDAGVCRGGACDTSCRTIDFEPEGCPDCLGPVLDGTSACGVPSDPCFDCAACPVIDGLSTCECLDDPRCLGCEVEAQALWDCGTSMCPMCVR